MAEKISFTNKKIEVLPVPEDGKRVVYHDARVPFLCVVVMPSGKRVFYLYRRIKGKPERVRIGFYPEIGINTARDLAAQMNGQVAAGAGVDELKRNKGEDRGVTLRQLFDDWLVQYAKLHKKTWAEDVRVFERFLSPLSGRALGDIGVKDLVGLHARIGASSGRTQANRVIALVSSLFSAAQRWELFTGMNPARGVRRFGERSRDRFLQPEEMARFFAALAEESNPTMRDFILMALLTGARKQTVAAMRWADIDLERGLWRVVESKTESGQWLPLVADAVELLLVRLAGRNGCEWVFPARFGGGEKHLTQPNKAFWRVRDAAGLEDLRFHDLRRSLGSWMAMGGGSLVMIGRALSHKSPASTAVYARLHHDPVRDAMAKAVAAMLAAGGVTGN